MTPSPSSPRIRRPLFWLLLAVAIVTPVFFLIYTAIAHHAPGWLVNTAIKTWFAATTFLCVWCALCVRAEPRLVRIALFWIAFLFLMLTLGSGTLMLR